MPFFLQKRNDEIGFYYLGDLSALPNKFKDTKINKDSGKTVNVVKMELMLDKPVEPRLYKYLHATT